MRRLITSKTNAVDQRLAVWWYVAFFAEIINIGRE